MRRFDATDVYLLAVLALFQTLEMAGSSALREHTATLTARLAHRVSHKKRAQIRTHLQEFFSEQFRARELDRIVRGTFHCYWRDTFMLARIHSQTELKHTARGLNFIADALKSGRGAILLENSFFGQRNAAKQILRAHGFQIHQTHSLEHIGGFYAKGETEIRARVIRPFLEAREKNFVAAIHYLSNAESLTVTRHLGKLLQSNELIYLSGEGPLGHKHITRNFLGCPRRFATGAVNLSKLTGAPILPLFCWRDEKDQLQLVIEPPLEFPSDTRAAEIGMTNFATMLEAYIRNYPDQYRNWRGAYLT